MPAVACFILAFVLGTAPSSAVRDNSELAAMDGTRHLTLGAMLEEAGEANEVVTAVASSGVASNSSTFVCHDLCILCGDGERAVFVKRSKHIIKKIFDIALVPVAAVGLAFAPWATLLTGGAYYLLEKNFAHKLGAECPNLQIFQFDKGQNPVEADLGPAMEDEDAPIRLLTKNLDKMYAYEQKLKREAAGQKDGFFTKARHAVVFEQRPAGTMTNLIVDFFDDSKFICGGHKKVKQTKQGPLIKEEGSLGGTWNAAVGAVTKLFTKKTNAEIGFAHTCMNFYKIEK
eukprot:CAMPEP_0179048912 /NCGR_PEP_ID=MMETSP0796-20121207/19947_1 /TAXON_ID=73915 /ORGANISM="Pyrodinium bahamense, Strain pbaha01" /LENGTH=286 /DNA_ID=CAMNT_0020745383 /DNA_START=72 /DNA_END=932 /DNA_ORIENTATION=-